MVKCEVCKKEFEMKTTKHIYCSVECQKIAIYGKAKETRKIQKAEKMLEKLKKKQNSILAISRMANEAGMTYGQYVAMMDKGKY